MDDQIVSNEIVLSRKEIEDRIAVLKGEHTKLLATLGQVQTATVQNETQVYLLTLLLEGKLKENKNE